MSRRPTSSRVRGTYIGGRDVAAIAGLDPYRSPLDVYAAIVAKKTVKQSGAMLRGLLMEAGLAEWVMERRRVKAERDVFFLDDDAPIFGASLDLVEFPVDNPSEFHEFKRTNQRQRYKWGAPGTDRVEVVAFCQTQWCMGRSGARLAHVWVDVYDDEDETEPLHYVVNRDDKAIANLEDLAARFWFDHIVPRVPPSAATSRSSDEALAAVYAKTTHALMPPTPELMETALLYDAARTEETQAGARKKFYGAALRAMLGFNERCEFDGGSVTFSPRELSSEPKVNYELVANDIMGTAIAIGVQLYRERNPRADINAFRKALSERVGDAWVRSVDSHRHAPKTATRVIDVRIAKPKKKKESKRARKQSEPAAEPAIQPVDEPEPVDAT